ncbi:Kynureninase [Sphingomonas laterariae]|uniref:Kynureninase n=1 Tax=Edaphosphingomonas laterariae TaxID=861865 RepID=A0A239CVW8_9SPHN|nr:kynureninase [Sphingomonas laterariae]SNS24365.1 Kynureninase [Sphingomonas laterariae]
MATAVHLPATLSREAALALDAADPLADFVGAFALPEGVIYLNGNSLGPSPQAALDRLEQSAREEWSRGLVTSWNKAGWFQLPYQIGDRIAGLIGAAPGEVVMTDGVSLNLYRMVAAALALRPDRRVIVMEGSNFPTDNYVVQGLIGTLGRGHEIRFAEKDEIAGAIDADVAAVVLTQVHYKSSHILDMAGITAQAQAAGALAVWDLCHSAGAIPIDLNGCNVDFAVGCTYKYLNGGPGSPGFQFAATRHQATMAQPLTGWWGHAAPFAFDRDYAAAPGIGRMLTGTQPILSMVAAEAGIDLAASAGIARARAKSLALGSLFQDLVQARLGDAGFALASPADADARGGHIAFDHPQGYPIMKALISRGVIGDFRAPTTMRFGFSPLYLRFADIWDAVDVLADVIETGLWRDPQFAAVDAVT